MYARAEMWKAEKSRLKYVQQKSANQKSGRALYQKGPSFFTKLNRCLQTKKNYRSILRYMPFSKTAQKW